MSNTYQIHAWFGDVQWKHLLPDARVDDDKRDLVDLTDEQLGRFIHQASEIYDVALWRYKPEKPRKGEKLKETPLPMISLDQQGGRFRQR